MKKTTYILIDKSGSMQDNHEHTRASAVNESMRQVMCTILPVILAEKDPELEPEIAVLTFSTHVEWLIPRTPMKKAVDQWKDIPLSEFMGCSSAGAAIEAVTDDIKSAILEDPFADRVAPAIILIADGQPTDHYEQVLDAVVRRNTESFCAPFYYATRIAIGIQADPAGEVSLRRFGHIHSSLRQKGIEEYISCTDVNHFILAEIIKHVTRSATLGL